MPSKWQKMDGFKIISMKNVSDENGESHSVLSLKDSTGETNLNTPKEIAKFLKKPKKQTRKKTEKSN